MINDKYLHRSEEDLSSLAALLETGQLSGTADLITRYEATLADAFRSPYAVAVSSGSTAIQAAFQVLGAETGGEILVPATAPLPSIFPISANGLVPVPVDVMPNTVSFDPDDLRRKITSKTRAAMAVPLWGYPQDISPVKSILRDRNIPLVEDAAHAHGAMLGPDYVGTLGSLGCFSTHDRKLISTGEGGFVLTGSKDLAGRLRSYSRLGDLTGEQIGVNFKLNALAAAIGLARVPSLDSLIGIRTANAALIRKAVEGSGAYRELDYPEMGRPNYYNLTLVSQGTAAESRRRLQELSSCGLTIDQVKYGYNVFYRRSAYASISASCVEAESLMERLVQVPVHPNLSAAERDLVIEILLGAA